MECSISGVVTDAKGEGKYHLPPLLTEYATFTKKNTVSLVPPTLFQSLRMHSFQNTSDVVSQRDQSLELKLEKDGKAQQNKKSSVEDHCINLHGGQCR